jgi:hypothetical protein
MSMVMPSTPPHTPNQPRSADTSRRLRRARQHGEVVDQHDRRALERAGWRTFLAYRENHVRAWDGTLLAVTPVWVAEAERADRAASARAAAQQASAGTIDEAWALLRTRCADLDRRATQAARQRAMRQRAA